MGKIRTKIIGIEDVEEKQKEEAKKRREVKKSKTQEEEVVVEKQETQEVKPSKSAAKDEKKTPAKLRKRGKKYLEAKKKVSSVKTSNLDTALDIIKKIKYASFDESVEMHLNVDQTGLKGEVSFPHSIGKIVRVRIVDDKTLEEIEKGKMEFDILIAHPSYMPKLARYAKTLGPKGLMPNPKAGTISPKPEEVAKKFEKGMTRWKTEPKAPLVHQSVGKISLDNGALKENIIALFKAIGKTHILAAFVKTTMGPSVKLNLEEV